jgi:hypothetical protein
MTTDIVAKAIVAALSAGAVTDTAKSAIADAYGGLKSLMIDMSTISDRPLVAGNQVPVLVHIRSGLSGRGVQRYAELVSLPCF